VYIFQLGDCLIGYVFLKKITKYLKFLGYFPLLSLCFNFDKNGLGYFFINSSGHPAHPTTTPQLTKPAKYFARPVFGVAQKLTAFRTCLFWKKPTIRLLDV
jgi:hypothetical protein